MYSSGIDYMSAAEMEVVVMSKLELANIAQQRHHAAMSARIILTAMKMLQSSNLFKEKKDDPATATTRRLDIWFISK